MNNKTNIEKDIKILNEFVNGYEDIGFKRHTALNNILADRERLQIKANKYDSLVKKIEKELEEKEQLRENYWERNTIRLHFIEENKQAEISEEELEINDKHMQLDGEIKKLKELMIFYKNY